jgi:hypothetical protein
LGKQTAASNTLQYVLIANNTFISNGTGIHFNNQMGSPRHVILVKNILCGRKSLPMVFLMSGFDPLSIENYSGNLYFDNSGNGGDDAPVLEDPQFVDTSRNNFSLQANSPACGLGAFPCASSTFSVSGKGGETLSPNIILYPTRSKHVFHIGLAGLDAIPLELELQDYNGTSLYKNSFWSKAPMDLKIMRNIDLTQMPSGVYIIKLTTSLGVLTQHLQIP